MKRILIFTLLATLGAVVAGCGEREQTALYTDGKYRGKPDTRPWDNAPGAYGAGTWNRGDRETWENQVKSRQQGQNENHRIGH
jgi:hypothetical protein